MFELPVENRPGATRWVLKVDSQHLQPGTGGGGQAFIGRFNGNTFIAASTRPQSLDLGEDYYASASWSNLPEPAGHVTLGWMDNWRYAQNDPTSPWRGAMTLPRRVSLRFENGTYHLMQRPIAELAKLRDEHRRLTDFAAAHGRALLSVPAEGGAHEIRTRIRVGRRGTFAFVIGSSDGRVVEVEYDAAVERFSVSREGRYRFSNTFDARGATALPSMNGTIELVLIIDRSSVEAYANDGELTVAERMFPGRGAYTVGIRSSGARIERMDIWGLRSIWGKIPTVK